MTATRAWSMSETRQPADNPEAFCARIHSSIQAEAPTQPGGFFGLRFGASDESSRDPAVVHVPLRPLGSENLWEIWAGPTTVTTEMSAGVGTVATTDHVVLHTRVPLAKDADISAVAFAVYHDLLTRVRDLGYPHLVRIWNFVPDINRGSGDAETYVQFNNGRAAAFDQLGLTPACYPAATGVGSPAGSPLTVIVLASRTEPVGIENPRQTSAYLYPRRYGPSSPAFARAMLLPDRAGATLFISGTASIVGHESQHRRIEPQLQETLTNLEQLLDSTAARIPGCTAGPHRSWRVYLRNPADLASVEGEVHRRLGGRDSVLFLQADICRRELLVEIEGLCELTRAPTVPDA